MSVSVPVHPLIAGTLALVLFPAGSPASAIRSQEAWFSGAPAVPEVDLLVNGGFESWSLPPERGPDRWFAQGDPSMTFEQTAIVFERRPRGSRDGDVWVVELTANAPRAFVAQSLQSPHELAGRTIRFSADLRAPVAPARASLQIDDGLTSSASSLELTSAWQALAVQHTVASSPTRLEFRIVPDSTVQVDNARAALANPGPAHFPGLIVGLTSSDVPLGTVLDWFRFDPTVPVPAGYAICDGTTITDPGSPFFGRKLPDLRNRFVRGAASTEEIGRSGGSDSASVAHDHDMAHTHDGWTKPNGSGCLRIVQSPPGVGDLAARCDLRLDIFTNGGSRARTGPSSISSVATIPRFSALLKIMRIK